MKLRSWRAIPSIISLASRIRGCRGRRAVDRAIGRPASRCAALSGRDLHVCPLRQSLFVEDRAVNRLDGTLELYEQPPQILGVTRLVVPRQTDTDFPAALDGPHSRGAEGLEMLISRSHFVALILAPGA
jgi:hypothetical protein